MKVSDTIKYWLRIMGYPIKSVVDPETTPEVMDVFLWLWRTHNIRIVYQEDKWIVINRDEIIDYGVWPDEDPEEAISICIQRIKDDNLICDIK